MKKTEYIYSVIYKDNIYFCVGNDVKKFAGNDYYFITNSGSQAYPAVTYHEKNNKEERIIGGFKELVNFVVENGDNKVIIIRGFGRSSACSILQDVKEAKERQKITKYKLIGTMNKIDRTTGFVYPVFENEGDYYFQYTENGTEITSFIKIEEEQLNRIRLLSETYNRLVDIKDYYTVGDEIILSFQLDENIIFIGNVENFIEFSKKYKTGNKDLKQEIYEFKGAVKLSKKLKK